MARLSEHGLRRTVGVPGLFATAYGNVGSSIYYALFVPHYLAAFWPALDHPPGDAIGGIVVIALLAGLNIRGLGESAKLNFGLAVLDLATQVLLAIVGIVLVLDPALLVHQVHLGSAPSWSQLIFALSVAMVAYTGIETVSNMAEEAKDPGRDVPRAVNLVVLAPDSARSAVRAQSASAPGSPAT